MSFSTIAKRIPAAALLVLLGGCRVFGPDFRQPRPEAKDCLAIKE